MTIVKSSKGNMGILTVMRNSLGGGGEEWKDGGGSEGKGWKWKRRFCGSGFLLSRFIRFTNILSLEITCLGEECKGIGWRRSKGENSRPAHSPLKSRIRPITPQNVATTIKKNLNSAASSWRRASAPTRRNASSPMARTSSNATTP